MSVSSEAFDNRAPFLGHPFGGAVRDADFAALTGASDVTAERQPAGSTDEPSSVDGGSFDFHLGVYARF